MKLLISFLMIVFFVSCSPDKPKPVTIEVDGIFRASEVPVGTGDTSLTRERYFSVKVTNTDSLPIRLYTVDSGRVFSPEVIEYSYLEPQSRQRQHRRGVVDFFSAEVITIPPASSRKMYFDASANLGSDSIIFLFNYLKPDSLCRIELSYYLENNKIVSLVDYTERCVAGGY